MQKVEVILDEREKYYLMGHNAVFKKKKKKKRER
jgi:hypothetical protein